MYDGWQSYVALSYTWGDATAERVIYINDELLVIHDNLWQFLNRARNDGYLGALWIDALYINQLTVKERNHQVSMMGEIYKRAESVIVWLCPSNQEVEEVMRCGLPGDRFDEAPSSLSPQQLERVNQLCSAPY